MIERACSAGSSQTLHLVRVLGEMRAGVESLIYNLSKLSVKVGGRYAATMLHRFLVAAEAIRLHAHDITVFHGLNLHEPIPLRRGAYLASYDAVRKRFALPEDPEWSLIRDDEDRDLHPGRLAHASSRGVLVRQVGWGLAVAPSDDSTNPELPLKLRYRFPDDHHVESLAGVVEERETLLHLLSIAVRSKLVSHTFIDALPRWMTQLDPNLRTASPGAGRGVFDVWPKDQAPCVSSLPCRLPPEANRPHLTRLFKNRGPLLSQPLMAQRDRNAERTPWTWRSLTIGVAGVVECDGLAGGGVVALAGDQACRGGSQSGLVRYSDCVI